MSQSSGRASESGQYAGIRAKIEKVATQALRTAAKSSKKAQNTVMKPQKTQSKKSPNAQ